MENQEQPPSLRPNVRLAGTVGEEMMQSPISQLDAAPKEGPLVFELATTGGDADAGRRLALEVRLLQRYGKRAVYFVGKSTVYSAGVTFMAAFPAKHRFLTDDCVLLIHERRMDKHLHLTGPLRGCMAVAKDALAEMVNGQKLERDGFQELIEGSKLSFADLMSHVEDANWYIRAKQAQELGLIAAAL